MSERGKDKKIVNARSTIAHLGRKEHLTSKEEDRLDKAKKITRRQFFKRAGVLTGGAALTVIGGGAAYKIVENLTKSESDEEVVTGYEKALNSVVEGDSEGEKLLDFYRDRKRDAHIEGDVIYADEEGDLDSNFWVVVDRGGEFKSNRVTGISEYSQDNNLLRVRSFESTDDFKGTLLAHELKHAYDDIMQIEGPDENSFYRSEAEAYDFEFRLLDNVSGKRFIGVLQEQSRSIEPGKFRGRLSDENFISLNDLFLDAVSKEELNHRVVVYTIALNFAAIGLRSDIADVAQQKAEYIRAIYSQDIPILPLD
ncbi:MAG: hypothetical protein UT24_C0012G0056 [Candidatus Woesebacteria bacterium GW2011_GWB1_39_12]|uniref:Twin-arginine translocation signal domain-containing protein n=2 Tax=Candidatus Woeseibacteriota TaxID=1752722 RepID=A0A0G0MBK9_9BACT|nr:MAG: hypothetical protein UT23_C0008G0018 [Candidatus Woesebacteria bacterium GW2011_GWA1_39_12]KKR00434.1 MAG: hypothetical protein UT24_C0012G0056 [Candidatus Woesebacteria bacterium GW2011_GWB1_39_12]